MFAFGNSQSGQLGLSQDPANNNKSSPVQIGALTNWAQITAGSANIGAVKITEQENLRARKTTWLYIDMMHLIILLAEHSQADMATIKVWHEEAKLFLTNMGKALGVAAYVCAKAKFRLWCLKSEFMYPNIFFCGMRLLTCGSKKLRWQ
jgi:hypothetical protein